MFAETDSDKDGVLSIVEWLAAPWTYFDPVWTFRKMDTNLDGSLDTAELLVETPAWKAAGISQLVERFDDNHDGQLSLNEYRLTPHANMILVWQKPQMDVDRDGRLRFEEFTVEGFWFQLMRSEYFQRFDRNNDGFLDPREYDFVSAAAPNAKSIRRLYVLNVDNKSFKMIRTGSMSGISIGSPAVSPDGKQIAFDALRDSFDILVMPIEGAEPKRIGTGVQPTWSPDSRKIACTRFEPRNGAWIFDLASNDASFLVAGRGTQWSPDGKTLLYQSGSSLMGYDQSTEASRSLLNANETDYAQFEFNASWSPDSRRISVIGTKDNGEQGLLIVDVTGKSTKKGHVRHAGKRFNADSSWQPGGHRLVFSMYCDERQRNQLYECDPDTTNAPHLSRDSRKISTSPMPLGAPGGKELYFVAAEAK